jgi:hypothetical protein
MISKRAMWLCARGIFALVTVGIFLSACGSATIVASSSPHTSTGDANPIIQTTASSQPLTAVDWMNFTYPSQNCGTAPLVTAHEGVADDANGHPLFVVEVPLNTDKQPDIQNGDPQSVKITTQGLTFSCDGYSHGVPHCCPVLLITDTFTWQSHHIVLTKQTIAKNRQSP